MKTTLIVLVVFFSFIACSRKLSSSKPLAVASKKNDFDKTREFVKALGFDLNTVTIDTVTKVNPDSILRFKSVEEGRAYFYDYLAALNKPKPITCLDTLMILSKARSKYYYSYLNTLKERARELMKKPIPGHDYNSTEWQQIPEGYECLMVVDTIVKPEN